MKELGQKTNTDNDSRKKTLKKRLLWRSVIFALLVAGWLIVSGGVVYLYALHLEKQWTAANPETRAELEHFLRLCSVKEIQASDAPWSHYYHVQEGERVFRYSILWHPYVPLDVVYDRNETIRQIFTTYE